MIGRKVERDRERGADGAGMHDQHGIARGQRASPALARAIWSTKLSPPGGRLPAGDFQNS